MNTIANTRMPLAANSSEEELSDGELLVGLSKGKDHYLEPLVYRFEKRLVNLIYRIIGDWGISLDLTQEAFLRIYRKAGTFRPDGNAPAWMLSVAVNVARDYARTKKNKLFKIHTSSLVEDQQADMEFESEAYIGSAQGDRLQPYEKLAAKERAEQVHSTLNAMPESSREVLLLRDFEQLSYTEMSEVLQCEVGTVKSRLHRARRIFEQLFKFE